MLAAVELGKIGTDEAVAAADVVVECAEWFAGRGSVEPEGEFGNFDRFGVDVDAVDVVRED